MKAIEASGHKVLGWVEGDKGHGRAFRFEDPFGHVFEIYWDTVRYEAPEGERPALKNIAQRYHGRGASPRRLDHLNLLAEDVSKFRDFMITCLGSRVTEYIQLDNGRIGGCWFTINNKTYDLACTEEHGGASGRLHHVTYATDTREDICAPPISSWKTAFTSRPGRTSMRSRARSSSMSGSRLATVWNLPIPARASSRARLEARLLDRDRAQEGPGLGLKTIETFHTHGTPPVAKKDH